MPAMLAKIAAAHLAVKAAAVFGAGLLVAVASGNDVIIVVFTFLNTGLLVLGNILTQRNRAGLRDVQETAEKTFQSTTHAANAAEGAARSAAISTIVATKHLGVDLREDDIAKLTAQLQATTHTENPTTDPAS